MERLIDLSDLYYDWFRASLSEQRNKWLPGKSVKNKLPFPSFHSGHPYLPQGCLSEVRSPDYDARLVIIVDSS